MREGITNIRLIVIGYVVFHQKSVGSVRYLSADPKIYRQALPRHLSICWIAFVDLMCIMESSPWELPIGYALLFLSL